MSILTDPRISQFEMGTPEWFAGQNKMVKCKPIIKYCYDLWYSKLINDANSVDDHGEKKIVLELGSGSSYLKELMPEVITSDLDEGVADMAIDARDLPFEDNSVKAIFLTHVFHHIPDIELFLKEANRVLIPGGKISMVDCTHTPLAKFFFSVIHPEPYDDKTDSWTFPQNNSMLDSNQALTWIIFYKNISKFQKLFPDFTVSKPVYLPWFSYLLSGGVNLRSLIPQFAAPVFKILDKLLKPFDSLFAIHWHLTITKKK
jgi:SAM-dependent methyltransferase